LGYKINKICKRRIEYGAPGRFHLKISRKEHVMLAKRDYSWFIETKQRTDGTK
jgi:hypothetical protein